MSLSTGQGRSRVRFVVLGFAVALAAVTYLDRVCIAHAGVTAAIEAELGLSDKQMSLVFSAFTLAYALFEIPTGAWGDRVGPRRVLTRIVVWWSSFTVATATVTSYGALLIVRFLFGAGEAGAFPNVTRTLSRWFPLSERGTAQGIFFAGAHLGGGLTPIAVGILLGWLPWRGVFVAFGLIGFVWALAWYRWFRDEPAEHSWVNAEELVLIEGGRKPRESHRFAFGTLRKLASNRVLLALCLMYFTQAYGFYFNITWLPTYLARERGLTPERVGILAGIFAGLPLILSSVADVAGGVTTDVVTRRFGLRAGRCGVGGVSLCVAGLAMIAGATARDPIPAALLIALSGASASFLLGASWGVCQDIGGPNAGLVAGSMNTAGQVGAVLSPVILPYFKNPAIPLCIAGSLYLVGALCWFGVDPSHEIQLDLSHEDKVDA